MSLMIPSSAILDAVVIPPLDFFNPEFCPTMLLSDWVAQPKDQKEKESRMDLAARAEKLAIYAAEGNEWRCPPVVFYVPWYDGPGFIWKMENNGTTIVVGVRQTETPYELDLVSEDDLPQHH